ncbi:MAG: hypothetical protein J6Y32_03385 [Bacteroidales bacterium]|nr:hypothetical protein [Bacteroidales bacterium]
MKKNGVVFVTILVAIITLSCSREKEIISEEVGRKLTITAYREDSEVKTRTTRDVNGVVSWSAHEDISLFYSAGTNGGSKFTSTNEAPATVADFSGTINVVTGVVEGDTERYFYGIYPFNEENSVNADGSIVTVIPDIQTAAEGTFADNHFVSMGRSRGLEMGFYNLCGGFKFKLLHEGVTKVTLHGNNNEELAGKVKVVLQDGRPIVSEVLDPKTELVMTCPDGGTFKTGVEYFFVMRPITFEEGFTFTMETDDSFVGMREVTTPIVVKRSLFSFAGSEIDSGVVYSSDLAVDLGLSVKWATCNLGATSPEGYGDYYAWGETETYYEPGNAQSSKPVWKEGKSEGYWWTSYKWCMGTYTSLTKYNNNASYGYNGFTDNKVTLEQDDDAAYAKMGRSWRMPTRAELDELRDNCTWAWTTLNGKCGFRVTGTNGNSIFLPASGVRTADEFDYLNSEGHYLSSSLSTFLPCYPFSYRIYYTNGKVYKEVQSDNRCRGYSVRAVTE